MKTRRVNDEVLYTDEPITRVTARDIAALKDRARANPRGRVRLCGHPAPEDALHEMLIVHMKECYVRPHRHMGRVESYHVIEGTATIAMFEEDGRVRECIPIGDASTGRAFYLRLGDPAYHSMLVESEIIVFHETTRGPFDPSTTVHAPWSPPEEDRAGVAALAGRIRSHGSTS